MAQWSDRSIAEYRAGRCPRCGGDAKLAGKGLRHYKPGAIVTFSHASDIPPTAVRLGGLRARVSGGEPLGTKGNNRSGDDRVCSFTSDDFYTLWLVIHWCETGRCILDAHDHRGLTDAAAA